MGTTLGAVRQAPVRMGIAAAVPCQGSTRRLAPHIRRPYAEFPAEHRAEMGCAAEADTIRDLRQRKRFVVASQEHIEASLQPPVPDPTGDGRSVEPKERMEIAQRDGVRFGDRLERQARVTKMVFKPRLDRPKARPLHDLVRKRLFLLCRVEGQSQHIHELLA